MNPRRIRTGVDLRRSTPAKQDIEDSPAGYDSDHTVLKIVQSLSARASRAAREL